MRIDAASTSLAFQTPIAPVPRVTGPQSSAAEKSGCGCGPGGCNCGGSKLGAAEDTVTLSPESREANATENERGLQPTPPDDAKGAGKSTELSDEEQAEVRELKARDAEVRAHEQAHLAAAGGHAKGGPTYEYERGPDGRNYAVGGEVSIDTSPVDGDPAATIAKMNKLIAAANAPAQPSGQDRAVAAQAAAARTQAQAELAEQRSVEASGKEESTSGAPSLDAEPVTQYTNRHRNESRPEFRAPRVGIAPAYPASKNDLFPPPSLLDLVA